MNELIAMLSSPDTTERRSAAARIRAFVREHPEVGDQLPDDVYRVVYRVRARGTERP